MLVQQIMDFIMVHVHKNYMLERKIQISERSLRDRNTILQGYIKISRILQIKKFILQKSRQKKRNYILFIFLKIQNDHFSFCFQMSELIMISFLSNFHSTYQKSLIKYHSRSGEMAQGLRAMAALPEILNSIPSNHMMPLNHL